MGKLEYFRIVLAKPDPVYFTGESVAGTVTFKVKERLKVNSVRLDALGEGKVHWIEKRWSGSHLHISHLKTQETYFNNTILFTAKDDQEVHLEAGEHSHPFQIRLPLNLPTSFECKNGRIRYTLTCTMAIPWSFDKHTHKAVTVISHVDLNQNPNLRQPYNLCESQMASVLCCKSDHIMVTLSLPKTGYVCGENLSTKITFNNQSPFDVLESSVNLNERLKFNAMNRSTRKTRVVFSFTLPKKIPKKSIEVFDSVEFGIPAICPSSLISCRIIELNYFLQLKYRTTRCNSTKLIEIPLTIGTIPLQEENSSAEPQNDDPPPPYSSTFNDQSMNFQSCSFGTVTESAFSPSHPENGEIFESDSNFYLPKYPCSNNPSVKY